MRRERLPLCSLHEVGDELCHYPRPQAVYMPEPHGRDPLHLWDLVGAVLLMAAVLTYFVVTGTL